MEQMEQMVIQIWNARVQILVEIGQDRNHSGKPTWGNFGTSPFSNMEIHMFTRFNSDGSQVRYDLIIWASGTSVMQ